MNDWTSEIAEKIAALRARLAGVHRNAQAARDAQAAAERTAARTGAPADGAAARLNMETADAIEARGAAKHARQRCESLERDEKQLQGEIARLEANLAIPERMEAAQAAAAAAAEAVAARTADLACADRTLRNLQEQKAAVAEALRAARENAGARMLEAARTGAVAATDDTAQLIARLDAVDLAIAAGEIEQQERRRALADALAQSKAAAGDVDRLALEASEVAMQVFTEQYVEMLGQHMASHWRVHRQAYMGPNVQHQAGERARAILGE